MLPIVFSISALVLMLLWNTPVPGYISSGFSKVESQQIWDMARFAASMFILMANLMFIRWGIRWIYSGGV